MAACKPNLSDALKTGSAGGAQPSRKRTRGTLVAVQIALATLLLVSTTALLRFYAAIEAWDFGNAVNELLVVQIERPAVASTEVADANYWLNVLARTKQVPGVEVMAATTTLPILSERPRPRAVEIQKPGSILTQAFAVESVITPGYFAAVGLPVRVGRNFSADDVPGSPEVCIVNETLARRVWPGQNPLGQSLRLPGEAKAARTTVVGVVGDFQNEPDRAGPPLRVFFPLAQRPQEEVALLVRISQPGPVIPALKEAIRLADLGQPVVNIRTIQQIASERMSGGYGLAGLLGSFALLALALSTLGIYGVVSYSVGQRTREIGIRMALGAHPSQILRMVIGEGLLSSLAGLALGLAGSWALLRVVAHETGVLRIDLYIPLIFLLAASVVVLVAVLACSAPARRAARLDPLVALRYE